MFRESIAQIIPKKNTVRPSVQTNQLCAFAAVKTTPVTAGPPVTSGVAPKPQLSTGKITEADIEQRARLLVTNRDLLFLHEKLVKTGVLTEAEFWESRKVMLSNESSRAEKQVTGIPSVLLADVRPTFETSNAVHYKLTPQIIQQIFLQFPAVQRAYADNVPLKISEQHFWQAYLQSQWFQRGRQRGGSSLPAGDLFAKYVAEDEKDEKG
jgi:transcription initiation factor TFIIH subunit 1